MCIRDRLSAALFALIPRRETWITDFGQATMYVYLLHTFVLYPCLLNTSPSWCLPSR